LTDISEIDESFIALMVEAVSTSEKSDSFYLRHGAAEDKSSSCSLLIT
jgi:hypothetical protein